MVLADTGAKLSKSPIRAGTMPPPPPGGRPWMFGVTAWQSHADDYVDALL
jgi:hypothetical protein